MSAERRSAEGVFGTDVLLNIPTESVAVRAVLASLAGLVLVRLLLRGPVRQPRLRAAAVLVPSAAILAVVVASWGVMDLPSLFVSSEADNALKVPFGNGYLSLAPVTWRVALAIWTVVASYGVARRVQRALATRREAASLFTLRATSPDRLTNAVADVASRLKVAPPPVAVADEVVGGASVVGVRRPVLLVDRDLLDSLDDEELEGLVAHELAHVRRRDNLVALLAGFCRDLAFFVPGGRWVIRQLHHEREAAADALAVEVTARPGALASGLLKAIESRQCHAVGAAALAPTGTLETRVRRLCADDQTSPARRAAEGTAIAGALAASVSLAIGVPAWVADGGEESRDVLALLWSSGAHQTAPAAPLEEHVAFSVYRDTGFEGTAVARTEASAFKDDGRELNPALLRLDPIDGRSPAERVGWSIDRPSLGLVPAPSITIDSSLLEDWRATTLLQVDEGIGVYWLDRGGR